MSGAGITGADAILPGDHQLNVVSPADDSRQPFRLYVPQAAADDARLPLLVVLHGKGANHHTWFERTPVREFAEQRGYLVAAPRGRGDADYTGPGEHDVLAVIKQVQRTCRVDADRVYLAGHSMGGWGAWYLGLRHPALFAAISPMAGPVPVELLPDATNLAPYIVHDAGDDIIDVECARHAARRLAELGIVFHYREEHGSGHDSAMIGAVLPAVFDWFDEHPRVPRSPVDPDGAPPQMGP